MSAGNTLDTGNFNIYVFRCKYSLTIRKIAEAVKMKRGRYLKYKSDTKTLMICIFRVYNVYYIKDYTKHFHRIT